MGFFVCVLIFSIAGIYIYQKDKFQSTVNSAQTREVEIQEQLVKDKERIEEEGKAVSKRRDVLIESLVIKHARVLCKKIRQEERIDEYGKEVGFDAVAAHVAHFLSLGLTQKKLVSIIY